MGNLAEKLAGAGHLTEEQVAGIKERSHAFVKAAMEDPKLLQETNEKLGGFLGNLARGFKDVFRPSGQAATGASAAGFPYAVGSAAGRTLPGTIGTGAVIGGLALGTGVGRAAVGAVRDRVQRARNYKSMMEANPQLSEFDPVQIQRAYNTLHKFNPEYASDPMVAGTFVATTVDQARMDTGTINNIVKARRELSQSGVDSSADFFRQMTPNIQTYDPESSQMAGEEHGARMLDYSRKAEEHARKGEIHPQMMETARQKAIKAGEEAARSDVEREESESQSAHSEVMRQRQLQQR